jgi:site-specific recombinase XerD
LTCDVETYLLTSMRDTCSYRLNGLVIDRFDEWLLVQHYAVLTKNRYMATARKFSRYLGKRALTTTTHSDVQQYLGKCARHGYTVNMLNIELLGLRSLFDFLSLGGLMKWVPP